MIKWFGIVLGTLFSACRTRRELALENLALRQQLAVMKHRQGIDNLTDSTGSAFGANQHQSPAHAGALALKCLPGLAVLSLGRLVGSGESLRRTLLHRIA